MLEKERSKRERQDIINELLNEEQATELQNRTINAAIEKNRIAKELLDDMMRQKLLIEERKANEIEIERSFGEYLKKERDKSIIADNRKAEERRKRGGSSSQINVFKDTHTRAHTHTGLVLENRQTYENV